MYLAVGHVMDDAANLICPILSVLNVDIMYSHLTSALQRQYQLIGAAYSKIVLNQYHFFLVKVYKATRLKIIKEERQGSEIMLSNEEGKLSDTLE